MSIQSQINAAASGAVVTIAPGTYNEGVVVNKPITLRATGPVLVRAPGNNKTGGAKGFDIQASNVTIDGLGPNGERFFDIVSPGNDGIEANSVHTITIRGVYAHDCGESGIQTNDCDRVVITDNTTARNAYMSWYSGISLYECRIFPAAGAVSATEFRNIVRNNISFANVTVDGNHADGDGIIIDDFMMEQDSPWSAGRPSYAGRTLVENNLCYGNGSKGIQCYLSEHVTIRRNTVVSNNVDVKNTGTYRGDLNVQACNDVLCEANIAVATRGSGILANNTAIGAMSRGVTWTNNLTWNGTAGAASVNVQEGGTQPTAANGNLLGVNPGLVDYAPTNPAAANMGWRSTGVAPTPVPEPEPVPPMPEAPDQLSPFATMAPDTVLTEAQAYELGTKIQPVKAGRITALRLYRTNTTAQPVRLWKGTTKVFEGSVPGGATGWVEVAVDVPAVVGDAFIVSVGKASAQKYATSNGALAVMVAGDGFAIPANGGVFATTQGALPTQTFQASYYWVDVRFAETVVVPEDPDMEEIKAALAALAARVDLIEGVPSDYGPRLIELAEKVATLDAGQADLNARLAAVEAAAAPDLAGIQEELSRLDGRLDAISGAAGD